MSTIKDKPLVKGSKCWVKSISTKAWCIGIVQDTSNENIKVRYCVGRILKEKCVPRVDIENHMKALKEIDISNVDAPFCICHDDSGNNHTKLQAMSLTGINYNCNRRSSWNISLKSIRDRLFSINIGSKNQLQDEEKEKEKENTTNTSENTDSSNFEFSWIDPNNKENVIKHCCICDKYILKENKNGEIELGFYCPNGKTKIHSEGFGLCLDCAMEKMGFSINVNIDVCEKDETREIELHRIDNSSEKPSIGKSTSIHAEQDSPTDKTERAAFELGSKPFAKGQSRYAYLGM